MKTALELAHEQADFLQKLAYDQGSLALDYELGSEMNMYHKGRSDAFIVAATFVRSMIFPIILKAKEESHELTSAFVTN